MDNFPPLNNSQNNNSVSGGRNVPPPPPPPIAIRTMDSDVKSIEQTGGAGPVPQMVSIKETEKPTEPINDIKINVPGYEGPEEKLFTPETLPSADDTTGTKKNSDFSRMIIFIVLFVVVAAGLGVAGYFLYPMFFSSQETTTPPPAATTTPPITPPISIKHNSYITSDGATAPVLSLTQAAAIQIATGTKSIIKEVILQDANNSQVAFSKYFPSIITEFTDNDLRVLFEDDFTSFLYYAGSNTWPGYVVKLKTGVPAAVAQMTIGKMEAYSSLVNLFLSNPGDKSAAGFKNGQINGKPSRYITFSTKDAAINYVFVGNYLLISTSYAGALEAEKRLIVSVTP